MELLKTETIVQSHSDRPMKIINRVNLLNKKMEFSLMQNAKKIVP